jgi:hypothetical protein
MPELPETRPVLSVAMTHEEYIHAVRDISVARLNDEKSRAKLLAAKLTYGSGQRGVRGTCFYEAWQNGDLHEFLEVCAAGEESHLQLIGTTLHELAHSLAGFGAGHSRKWKASARALGLIRAEAAGQAYVIEDLDSQLWARLSALPIPADGNPAFDLDEPIGAGQRSAKTRPCPLGIGTRGGISRGQGSGSRLMKIACSQCNYPVWTTRKWLRLGTPTCICGGRMIAMSAR